MSLRPRSEAIHIFANVGASGVTALVPAVAGQLVRVYRLIVTSGFAGTNGITLQDTSNNALSQTFNLIQGGSIVLDTPINEDPWWVSSLGTGIQWNTTQQPYSYDLWYLQGP